MILELLQKQFNSLGYKTRCTIDYLDLYPNQTDSDGHFAVTVYAVDDDNQIEVQLFPTPCFNGHINFSYDIADPSCLIQIEAIILKHLKRD